MQILYKLTILLSILLFSNCNNTKQEENTLGIEEMTQVPEDFSSFYLKFHSDSVFQLNHITFPLQGIPALISKEIDPDEFTWSKEDWKFHSFDNFDPDQYQIERQTFDSTLVTEKIIDIKTNIGIKRRFAKFNDEWYLIYYSAMNPQQ
ncbi:DUF4348 domain-containing protein [Membranihabitans marinus]|uniref:DUF4348 domain-containing protein n=1 Tax=Membranihabitans marinus TaxID=1227546 RepID=UPI001F30D441|nr:DUF4348 domain-containing protein [Membranihabitans marinus]